MIWINIWFHGFSPFQNRTIFNTLLIIPLRITHSDYKHVTLTSHVQKALERLVLFQMRLQVRVLDPLQFAYQPNFEVDYGVIYLLQRAHIHLDGGESTVRIIFFDFS